jgi:hypothetical protein
MPIKDISCGDTGSLAKSLTRRLAREWKKPKKSGEPVIVQKSSRASHSAQIYVVWSEWGDLSQEDRSEIIMDAYEQTHSPQEALILTVAMGLTPAEADKMEIPYR